MQQAEGIIIVYDLTDRSSLQAAEDWWNQVTQQIDTAGLAIALVGNKSDDIER